MFFKYLGHQISSRDDDALALFMNIAKAHKRLSHLSVLISRELADPVVGGTIYVATVLVVLLFGLKFWGEPPVYLTPYANFIIAVER